jgi:hypothetical protein
MEKLGQEEFIHSLTPPALRALLTGAVTLSPAGRPEYGPVWLLSISPRAGTRHEEMES